MVTSVLMGTKLYRPSLPPKRVMRPHLVQRMNEGLESKHQLTLVSAPAGFGKTICVSEWVDQLQLPISWLSLEAVDDDPGRFFSYFVAAFQQVNAPIGQEIEGILRAGQLPPGEIISTTLINGILDIDQQFVLVLDDFQHIQDEFILDVVDDLVTNLPQTLHLVLVTREDPSLPLARMRANNQLTEIRAGDLRFTIPETESYLNQVMNLSLSQADIAALEERTEGWIAGLHLAGLSIRNRPNPSNYIANLSGSHRFILNYLTEEVLNQQPGEIQQFLLQTAILDRLSGDLCDAITGRTDSHHMLERLYTANLFLVPQDDQGHWYRYHQLFIDLLRDLQITRLKDDLADLHQRASLWYAQAGLVSEAIEHSLKAGNYASALQLIEKHAMDLLMQWHIKTVEGWMQAVPAEWCAQSPRANLAFAWMNLMRGNHSQAAPYLQRLQTLFSDPKLVAEDPLLQARWFALQSMLLNAGGKPDQSLHYVNRALDNVPGQEYQVRSMLHLEEANAYQQLNDYDRAVDSYHKIIEISQLAGNSVYEMLGISGLALLAIQHGQYHYAFEIASQGIDRIERSGSLPPISTAVYGELGVIYYQWYQLDLAHHNFQRAIQVSTLSGYSDAEVYYGVILSRLFQIRGDLAAAAQEIEKIFDLMQINAPTTVREEAVSQQVRVYLAQDRLDEAQKLLASEGFTFQDGFSYPDLSSTLDANRRQGVMYASALGILLYTYHRHHDHTILNQGIELANQLIAGSLQHNFIPFALESLLLRAQMHTAVGNEEKSMADYLHALQLAEPEGFVSFFIEGGPAVGKSLENLLIHNRLGDINPDYVKKILAAFSQSQPISPEHPAALIEGLTDRELDVLRLMVAGLKYEEIAARLYISLNTVRSHVKSIYGKLSVNNRTKAIETAHELGII